MAAFLRLVLALLLALSALAAQSRAQSAVQTEQQKLLELQRNQLNLYNAKQKLEKIKKLYEEGLETKVNLDEAEIQYRQAVVEYQRSFLALFSETPRISVLSAVKSQTADGKKQVRVVIKNTSGATLDYKSLGIEAPEVPVPDELKLRELRNIFISLKDEKNTVISEPYEAFVPALGYGEERAFTFGLLNDVDVAYVAMTYAGKLDERPVYLQKDASANIVTVQSTQFSQEADLGATATYDLKLERFTRESNVFKLQVVNLPRQIQYDFLESREGSSRLSQYRFPQGETTKQLALKLYLPELANERELEQAEINLDRPLSFYVLVLDEKLAGKYPADRRYSEAEIEKIPAGRVRLELIPRGVGKVEVSLTNYYQEIRTGENLQFEAAIRNTGTRILHNIKVNTELPFNWRADVEPDIIPELAINKEARVRLQVFPPADVTVGEYHIKVKTDAYASSRKVPTEDKDIRVNLVAPTNIWSTVGLIGVLLGLVTGIVVFGVRLTRR